MSESVLCQIDHSIATITLNKAAEHNALTRSDIGQFIEYLEEIVSHGGVRVLLISGNGDKTFCAGASLREFDTGAMSGELFEELTDRIAAVPIPTVCALNGSVYGGGAEIALCCDFRIGVTGSRLQIPATHIGICYPYNGIKRYVSVLGPSLARRMLLAGEVFDAEALLACGFLDQLVPREHLGEAAGQRCQNLAQLAPLASSGIKTIISDLLAGTSDRESAEALIRRCQQSQDLQEGLLAKREKRSAVFKGQ